jgi:hypothetical protein
MTVEMQKELLIVDFFNEEQYFFINRYFLIEYQVKKRVNPSRPVFLRTGWTRYYRASVMQ